MANWVKGILALVCAALVLSGCGTGTKFILPEGTRIYLVAKDRTFSEGKAKMRPFWWNSFSGIDFKLLKERETVREGSLDSDFRVTSFFWPPLAFLYWPIGFEWNCYDLTGPEPVECGN